MKGQRYRPNLLDFQENRLEKSLKKCKSEVNCRKSNTTPISFM